MRIAALLAAVALAFALFAAPAHADEDDGDEGFGWESITPTVVAL